MAPHCRSGNLWNSTAAYTGCVQLPRWRSVYLSPAVIHNLRKLNVGNSNYELNSYPSERWNLAFSTVRHTHDLPLSLEGRHQISLPACPTKKAKFSRQHRSRDINFQRYMFFFCTSTSPVAHFSPPLRQCSTKRRSMFPA